ncbi:hypothetical protein PAPYR_5545 [Paratrimastix pyriformis]|uniref:MD-2-related lipid-recognition domain-containing protein n=1 Tax=Paratrimastix pyriformis TaxID=342808 RepID=A0ABQ8UPC9_9EUKA|nr:hypothetical protein PAPYR_5545 [Paratrimastix pyriformis]
MNQCKMPNCHFGMCVAVIRPFLLWDTSGYLPFRPPWAVTGGTAEFSMRFGEMENGLTFHPGLCTFVGIGGQSCPFPAGPFAFETSMGVPWLMPSGRYRGHVVVTDESGHELLCVDYDVDLRKGESPLLDLLHDLERLTDRLGKDDTKETL